MRVLFASTRGAGHFNPLVPFLDAARRGGHEVLVAGPPPLRETVERHGIRHARIGVGLAATEELSFAAAAESLERVEPGIVEALRARRS
jgi:UDP:flavonoid glycosyltransferase YjiC (YdhE family)